MIPFIFTCKITYLAGNEHNCGLSFPARYYAEVTPVLSSLLFVIIALTRTVVAKNQQVQISISPPLPLLPFDRRPPPWYKFLSPLMALAFRCCKKTKMAALIFTKKILSTRSPKLRLLCRLAKIILQLYSACIWYVTFPNRLWHFLLCITGQFDHLPKPRYPPSNGANFDSCYRDNLDPGTCGRFSSYSKFGIPIRHSQQLSRCVSFEWSLAPVSVSGSLTNLTVPETKASVRHARFACTCT